MRKVRRQVGEFIRNFEIPILDYSRKNKLYTVKCTTAGCDKRIKRHKSELVAGVGLFCRPCTSRRQTNRFHLRPYESLYNLLRWRANHRKIDFDLTLEQFQRLASARTCIYCSGGLLWSLKRGSVPLDRRDNSRGYVEENCVACCGECNRIKSDIYSFAEMLTIGKALASLRVKNE